MYLFLIICICVFSASFMLLLCLFAEIDTVMTYYDKLVPHVCISLHVAILSRLF